MSLLDEFKKAAVEAALDLNLNPEEIEFRDVETPKIGLSYSATILEGVKNFDFFLRTTTDQDDPTTGTMKAFLTIGFTEGGAPYSFSEKLEYIKNHHNFLSRWISWAIFNYRKEHEKTNLETLFYDVDLRVYGIPGYGKPAEEEAKILFNGLLSLEPEKVLVYKFRHIKKDNYLCRDISYAIFVNPAFGTCFWAVFPDNCGLDSGGAHNTYRHFENLITELANKIPVEIRRYDIDYEELNNFLLKHESGFFSCQHNNVLEPFHRFFYSISILISEEQEKQFIERLEKKEYPEALRNLRALVQQAQENLVIKKEIELPPSSERTITKLAGLLIRKGVIDGRLNSWFSAFASIANLASHGNYPTKEEMEESESRILLTFYLGLQLIKEMEKTITPKIEVSSWKKIEK